MSRFPDAGGLAAELKIGMVAGMQKEPFFHLEGEHFTPTSLASGTWADATIHGRSVVGVVSFELERRFGDPDFQPARLTVDLYRMAPAKPFEVRTRWLREGGRVRVAEGELVVDGKSCARASLMFLRKGESSPHPVWGRGPWGAPLPAELPDLAMDGWNQGGRWEIKPVAMENSGPRGAWTRETREMVGGFPLTPFVRAASAVDLMSGLANSYGAGIDYINADFTLYLHRSPAGEWVGLEAIDHEATAGVATGAGFVHDEQGPIGFAGCGALHRVHPPRPAG